MFPGHDTARVSCFPANNNGKPEASPCTLTERDSDLVCSVVFSFSMVDTSSVTSSLSFLMVAWSRAISSSRSQFLRSSSPFSPLRDMKSVLSLFRVSSFSFSVD